MTHLELLLLNYLVNALWQVPLLLLAATLAARLTRTAGPHVQHRIWVAALLLETTLPACAFAPRLRELLFSFFHPRAGAVTTQITLLGVAAPDHSHSPLLAAIPYALLAYAATLLYFAARLAFRFYRTNALGRAAHPVTLTGEPLAIWQRYTRVFAVYDAHLAASSQISGPSTIGIRRRLLLLPPALLASATHEDLAAALAHEFAHMRRRDFATNLLYQLVALPIAFHPLLWVTQRRIAESREMVCDQLAAQATHGATRYAHSLLRLAASFSAPAATLHTIGILDANILERRVMTLTRKHSIPATPRRIVTTGAALLLGLATCASAMSLRFEVPAQAVTSVARQAADATMASPQMRQSWAPSAAAAQANISGAEAAGHIVSKVSPIYPPEAKEQGIQGAVLLHAIIGKDGAIQQLAVLSGPPMLVPSAMEAVKQWVYQPFLLNGAPVEVETTITVNYSLSRDAAQQPPSPASPPEDANEQASQENAAGGPVYEVGGSVHPPIAIYTPDPQYSQEARNAKRSASVVVGLMVDPGGIPRNVHVVRGAGMGLDEKAVEAVLQYRFKPATQNGNPVPVHLNIEVNFQYSN